MKLRIGSRRSPLARAQAGQVAEALVAAHPDLEVEWVWITTSGDRFRDRPLADVGGKGLFLKEIQEALLAGEIDLAIHSGKDIPGVDSPGLRVAATPRRASPWDVLAGLGDAPGDGFAGRIGTGSGRRMAQLRRRWPQTTVAPIRGNVGTRLGRVRDGDMDAVVLAEAGMTRLNVDWEGTLTRLDWMIPATAQGTLALEIRADDELWGERLQAVHDAPTWAGFTAERAVQQAVGGDCFLPFAVFAALDGEAMHLRAGLWAPDGQQGLEIERRGAIGDGVAMGRELGAELRRDGEHLL